MHYLGGFLLLLLEQRNTFLQIIHSYQNLFVLEFRTLFNVC